MDIRELLTAGAVMTGLAAIFGVILAVAYRFLKVEEDPLLDELEALLPGSNCGACGEPGCRAFAEKLAAKKIAPGQCTSASSQNIDAIAQQLGIDAGYGQKRVARLHCAGGEGRVKDVAEYRGAKSCRAAVLVNSGGRACSWGCLGLGDCERACTFDAIKMNDGGLPVVSVKDCTACNDCVLICPLDLFSLQPLDQHVTVQCASPLQGEEARAVCSVACDACGRCESDAKPGTIKIQNGLPVIIHPEHETLESTLRCPTGAITWLEGQQFRYERDEPEQTADELGLNFRYDIRGSK